MIEALLKRLQETNVIFDYVIEKTDRGCDIAIKSSIDDEIVYIPMVLQKETS